jgi:methionine-rich copper-binding protein CopC
MTRLFACAAAAAALLGLAAGPASAHVRLLGSEPRAGASLAAAPARLVLQFSEVPRLAGTGVELTGPDGRARLLQPLARDRRDVRRVSAPLPAGLGPGLYVVRWRALSPDAHRTRGELSFRVGGPAR